MATNQTLTLFHGTLLVKYPDGEAAAFTLSGFSFEAFNREVRSWRESAARTGKTIVGFKGYFTCGNEFGSCDYTGSELMDPGNFNCLLITQPYKPRFSQISIICFS